MRSFRSLAFAALVVLACVLLRYSAHLSFDAGVVEHDWYAMHWIDAKHVERSLQEGSLFAHWSPWILGGAPLSAVPTKPFTYPPFLLAVGLCGPTLAMNVLLLAHLVLGGVGTALLAKRLGLAGIAPAVCGALFVLARFPAFGFVSAPYGFGYAVAWWPWTLLCWVNVLEGKRNLAAALGLAVTSAAQWHAGGENSFYWLACFGAAFGLPYLAKRWRAAELRALLGGCALAALVFVGLIAIKLLPELAWLETSGRSAPLGMEFARDSALEEQLAHSGTTSRLVSLVKVLWREFSAAGAWTLLVGGAFGIYFGARKRAWLALLSGTLVCFVLTSGALHEFAYDYLPGYDRMRRHSRFVSMVGFGLILLAGYGLQLRSARGASWKSRAACLFILCGILIDTSSVPGLRFSRSPMGSTRERLELSAAQLAPVLADEARGRLHFMGHREQPAWVEFGLESTGGALGGPGTGNALYSELLEPLTPAQKLESNSKAVLDVLNVRYIASPQALDFAHLENVTRPEDVSPAQIERLRELHSAPYAIYRRTSARPRAAMVQAPTWVVGEASARRRAIVSALRTPGHDAAQVVLLESEDGLPAKEALRNRVLFAGRDASDPLIVSWRATHSEGQWTAVEHGMLWTRAATRIHALGDAHFDKTATTITVDVAGALPTTAPAERILLLSELATLAPGWSATIDGVAAPLLRADGLVSALRLTPGARVVQLAYSPPGFVLGAWITGATLAALLVLAFVASYRSRRITASK